MVTALVGNFVKPVSFVVVCLNIVTTGPALNIGLLAVVNVSMSVIDY